VFHQLVRQQSDLEIIGRQLHQFRRARIRHERHCQRHGGSRRLHPYVGTFLTFSDYARNAVRMAALMKIRTIFVYTHDSIGLGEDGPTHQAVEHAASLRLIPHMEVWRPCDTVETAVAWVAAIERRDGPTCLLLTRQNVPFQPRDGAQIAAIPPRRLRARRLEPVQSPKRVVVIATGSEVALAIGARSALAEHGIDVRVVSMPCTSIYDRQDAEWRRSVLPPGVPRVAVEAGATDGWRKYVGASTIRTAPSLALDTFGESAARRRAVQALRIYGRGSGRGHHARRCTMNTEIRVAAQ
jgi:transketolase